MRDKNIDYSISTISCETLKVSVTQPIPPQFFGLDKEAPIFVGGSCNGLVCIYDFRALLIVMWNPATRETKVVPRCTPAGYRTVTECLGFGFDAKTNDYKIIHLFTLYDPHGVEIFKLGIGIPQKEVYNSSANSWRKVDGPSCFVYSVLPSTRINGMVSWIAAIEDREKLLLSFNMTDEVFLETPLRWKLSGRKMRLVGLGTFLC
jgi:F-box interacting protein